jgi:hypothetical protein
MVPCESHRRPPRLLSADALTGRLGASLVASTRRGAEGCVAVGMTALAAGIVAVPLSRLTEA